MKEKIVYFARFDGVVRMGPYASEIQAWGKLSSISTAQGQLLAQRCGPSVRARSRRMPSVGESWRMSVRVEI